MDRIMPWMLEWSHSVGWAFDTTWPHWPARIAGNGVVMWGAVLATGRKDAQDCIQHGYGTQPAGIEWIMARKMEKNWDPFSEGYTRQSWMAWPTIESLVAKSRERFNPLVVTTAISSCLGLLRDLPILIPLDPLYKRIRLCEGQLWSAHQYLEAATRKGLVDKPPADILAQCVATLNSLAADLHSADNLAGYHAVKAVLVDLQGPPAP